MPQIVNRITGGGFRFNFVSRSGGDSVKVFAERLQIQKSFEEGSAGIFYGAVERWRRQSFNARLPRLISQALWSRTPAGRHTQSLSNSTLEWVHGPLEEPGRERTYLYHLRMKMPGHAAEYGYTQEVGRPANAAMVSGKYYLVPLLAAFGNERHVDIKKELDDPNVWFLPRGENNFGTDRAGRKVKYVFRFKNKRSKAASQARAKAKAGDKVGSKNDLKGKGTLLFLAYPDSSTGIPGASRGKYAKKTPKLASPMVRSFGFSPVPGAQASRWFTYSLIKTIPTLDKFLRNTSRQLAGAVKATGTKYRGD